MSVTDMVPQHHEETSLTNYQGDIGSVMDTARVFVQSGFFQDVKSLSQAAVKIMAGREYGFGPFASMRGVYIISGKCALESNLMATAIKRGGKYNYRVIEHTDRVCSIDFYEHGTHVGNSTFTADDAKKAGTKNMERFPRNMLFARALSNGAKWFCPDAFGGAPVYSPEEFHMEQRADGSYVEPAEVTPEPVDPEIEGKIEAGFAMLKLPAEEQINLRANYAPKALHAHLASLWKSRPKPIAVEREPGVEG